jgi:sortase A
MGRAILPDADVALGVECALPVAQGLFGNRDRGRWARSAVTVAAAALLAAGLWQFGQGAYIHAKARLAQALMGQAWARTLEGEREVKPWPWADTWPVARLFVPDLDVDLFVLAGANGRTIAFGPGHLFGTPLPGEAGNSAIGGHRDTHLAFLSDLAIGAEIVVERPDGARRRYRVDWASVLDKREVWVLKDEGPTRLTLITCYPFDALRAGGPLRYVVTARATDASP